MTTLWPLFTMTNTFQAIALSDFFHCDSEDKWESKYLTSSSGGHLVIKGTSFISPYAYRKVPQIGPKHKKIIYALTTA